MFLINNIKKDKAKSYLEINIIKIMDIFQVKKK